MKQLILVRHAKSSWADDSLRDIERPLNKRGLRNAPQAGLRLAEAGVVVDQLYSSPAVRALHTAELVAQPLGFSAEQIKPISSLYTFNYEELLGIVRSLDDSHQRVMLVCHNPAITDLVNFLALSHLGNIPTAGVAVLGIQNNQWQEVSAGSAELVEFDYPKKDR